MRKITSRAWRSGLVTAACLAIACGGQAPPTGPRPNPTREALPQALDVAQVRELESLALIKDPKGVGLSVSALRDPNQATRARAAMALEWYGLPVAETAREPLIAALKESGPVARPALVWALVALGEPTVGEQAWAGWQRGELQRAVRVDGSPAFDVVKFARVVGAERIVALYADGKPERRRLAAELLSQQPKAIYAPQLIELTKAPEAELRVLAGVGLARLNTDAALQGLTELLVGNAPGDRPAFLQAISDALGTRGLLSTLRGLHQSKNSALVWVFSAGVLALVREDADPAGAEPLLAFIAGDPKAGFEPHAHWRGEAAIALAEIGDARAAPHLAECIRMDVVKAYAEEIPIKSQERADDRLRADCARALADLALMVPEQVPTLREQTEDALIAWNHSLKFPEESGLRALARLRSTKDIRSLRSWAFPKKPVPPLGARFNGDRTWETASAALRYLGSYQLPEDLAPLLRQIARRARGDDPKSTGQEDDPTRQDLVLVLSYLSSGASAGLSERQDHDAVAPLFALVDDPKQSVTVKYAACTALTNLVSDADMPDVVERLRARNAAALYQQSDERDCYLYLLRARPQAAASPELFRLLENDVPWRTRSAAVAVLGMLGFGLDVVTKLLPRWDHEFVRVQVATALILGGNEQTAGDAMLKFLSYPQPNTEDLRVGLNAFFSGLRAQDIQAGRLGRWVNNAFATVEAQTGEWPSALVRNSLIFGLRSLAKEDPPGSPRPNVLRHQLLSGLVQGGQQLERDAALRVLLLLDARGALRSLARRDDALGFAAKRTYEKLISPEWQNRLPAR